jgi:hypothetical protein
VLVFWQQVPWLRVLSLLAICARRGWWFLLQLRSLEFSFLMK